MVVPHTMNKSRILQCWASQTMRHLVEPLLAHPAMVPLTQGTVPLTQQLDENHQNTDNRNNNDNAIAAIAT